MLPAMNFKGLFSGIVLIILVGIAGFAYTTATNPSSGPIACTMDAKMCPDGTGLGRTGPECTFPACPPPNVDLPSAGLSFALPPDYAPMPFTDQGAIAAFSKIDTASNTESDIIIRQFTLVGTTTPSEFIRTNAIMDPSGMPASPAAFTSVLVGSHRFSLVTLGRFEGVVNTVYYLSRENDVLRFDALSRGVMNWTDPALDVLTLPANQDLRALLTTLQGN
jgi:hypothetical protein